MTLTEEDFSERWNKNGTLRELIIKDRGFTTMKQILKNQEIADKWNKVVGGHGLLTTPEEIYKWKEIVELLKNFFNGDNVLTKQEYKRKILGDKK